MAIAAREMMTLLDAIFLRLLQQTPYDDNNKVLPTTQIIVAGDRLTLNRKTRILVKLHIAARPAELVPGRG